MMKKNNAIGPLSYAVFFCVTLLALPTLAETNTAEDTGLQTDAAGPTNSLFQFELDDIADNLVIIEATYPGKKIKKTCGFIAIMDEKPYLITRQSFILGADRLNFLSFGKRTLKPRSVELSADRDLARFGLADGRGFIHCTKTDMDDPVAVFGATESNGTNFLEGVINGVGADIFEISAAFDNEQHIGCPILNPDQQVLGMASYSRHSRSDVTKEGTRFENNTRRFCQRFTNTQWRPTNWKRYNQKIGSPYRTYLTFVEDVVVVLKSWADGPLEQVCFSEQPQKALGTWAEAHNTVVKEPVGTGSHRRDFYINYSESSEKLANLCRLRARELYKLAEQRGLTEFTTQEFESLASTLEYFAEVILRYGSSTY